MAEAHDQPEPAGPRQAQAAYVAADDEFLAHKRGCSLCGQTRRKYPHYCAEGIRLSGTAIDRRKEWADAVAAERTVTRPERRD